MRLTARRGVRLSAAFVAYAALAAVIALPLSIEQAVQRASFEDRLGSFPVEIGLAHNGSSTLDTGVFGKLYYERTGFLGFGVTVRSTGPPEAGGTLTSYVSSDFLQANAAYVDNPDEVAAVYGEELRADLLARLLRYEVLAGLIGGVVLLGMFRGRRPPVLWLVRTRRRQVAVGTGATVLATSLVAGVAVATFHGWEGTTEVGTTYALPGVDGVSFSSQQAREVAQQVVPFIQKNTTRIEERAQEFEAAALASAQIVLPAYAASLTPREGETVVLAEADPQGSLVATRVRKDLYPVLEDLLGADSIALRTISGDVSSNGAVAEKGFIEGEAAASPDIPTVAVKGDHDSQTTVEQLRDNGVTVPDQEIVEKGGLRVAGASDPNSKALFGGLVTNDTGVTETDIGVSLRTLVDDELSPDEPVLTLLHQPTAVAAYLGITGTSALSGLVGHETTPYDDGIADVPPGEVDMGHLHDQSGPFVIWNTDGDLVTWTVVSQLGTSGGVEENPTFNRFSTPFSVPLKDMTIQLQYVNEESGLQTGYASVVVGTDGTVTVEDRVDLGLPGGLPLPRDQVTVETP